MKTPTPTREQIEAALAVIACKASLKDVRSVKAFTANSGFILMNPIESAGRILAAALFATKEDARRYRAIKEGGWNILSLAVFDKTGKQQPGVRYEVCAKTEYRATNLDDAIDAAIAAEKKGLQ